MPPEQITEQKKNEKTDIYQLGALLYTMIFKHCPVEGDNVDEILEKTLAGEVFVDSINRQTLPLIKICKKAMSPDPADRYNDVRAIINEIKEIKIEEPHKKNHIFSYLVAALLPFALIISGFFFIDEDQRIARSEFLPVQQVIPKHEVIVETHCLLTTQDIALLEEFSHFGAEDFNEPLTVSNSPVPAWYNYLDKVIMTEMGPLLEEDILLLIRIQNFISFNITEEGL